MAKEPTTSVLSQIKGELKEAKRKALKGELKGLMEEYLKANEVLAGIEGKIAATLEKYGEPVGNITEILSEDV